MTTWLFSITFLCFLFIFGIEDIIQPIIEYNFVKFSKTRFVPVWRLTHDQQPGTRKHHTKMTTLSIETLTLPSAPLGPENPLPFFRDPQTDRPVTVDDSLPPEKLEKLGWQTGFRVLPYRMQDQYTRRRKPVNFKAVVLQNQYLRATFLPEVGGRLVSLVDLQSDRELLFFNPVIQPANLAIRNAWFAGGIEWNIAQFGHSFHTFSPVFAAQIESWDGSPALRLYDFERCKALFWQVDFHLPEDSRFLLAYTRVVNPQPRAVPMYWWTNIAVPEKEGQRVLAPAEQAIYMHAPGQGKGFGMAPLPNLPSLDGIDGTYPLNYPFSNEFFFQCDASDMPWETALDIEGYGLVAASTPFLRYRKMFCWGNHPGGRHWQDFLSVPGEAYLEIQAGLAPTQLHGIEMPAENTWDWLQAFGALQAAPEIAHQPDWQTAVRGVEQVLTRWVTPTRMQQFRAQARGLSDQPPRSIIHQASGWGALEVMRLERERSIHVSPGLTFPADTLGAEQRRWIELFENGSLPEQDAHGLPGEWMVQDEWRKMLEESITGVEGGHWFSWLHLGVMHMERFDEAGAQLAWRRSLEMQPNAWAARNLAWLVDRQGDAEKSLALYQQTWALVQHSSLLNTRNAPDLAGLVAEILAFLNRNARYEQTLEIYAHLPDEIQHNDRVQLILARAWLETEDYAKVTEIFKRDLAVIQEGETVLTDLWFELWARQVYSLKWEALNGMQRDDILKKQPAPQQIDFRVS
jgi:hypothetical protein